MGRYSIKISEEMIARVTGWIGNVHLYIRLLLALISASLTLPVFSLGFDVDHIMNYIIIGGIFGALVLVPFVTSRAFLAVRICILIIASIFIYWLTVQLALNEYGPLEIENSVVVSGLLGAILVGIVVWVAAPLKISKKFWIYVPLAGLLGGILFQVLLNNNYIIPQYVSWQLPVCLSLHLGCAKNPHSNSALVGI